MHHLLREPQVARRGAMRPLMCLRRLLGPDEGVPNLPRSCADVDARAGGVMSSSKTREHLVAESFILD